MKRIYTVIIVLFICILPGYAQRSVFYDYSWLHKTITNPAMSGIDGALTLTLSANKQWAGIINSPSTQILSIQGKAYTLRRNNPKTFLPKPSKDHVGLGLLLYHDENGPEKYTAGQFAYAYHFKIFRKYKMSLGLSFSFLQFVLKESEFKPYDTNDPLLTWGNDTWYNRDFNAGITFYQPGRFCTGFAVAELLGNNHSPESLIAFKNKRNLFFTANYIFDLGYFGSMEPSLMIRNVDQYGNYFETGLKIIYHKVVWMRLYYRLNEALITTFGMEFKRLTVGYDFDCSLSRIIKSTLGSHGIFLVYKF